MSDKGRGAIRPDAAHQDASGFVGAENNKGFLKGEIGKSKPIRLWTWALESKLVRLLPTMPALPPSALLIPYLHLR